MAGLPDIVILVGAVVLLAAGAAAIVWLIWRLAVSHDVPAASVTQTRRAGRPDVRLGATP
jgi:hypothetical protein